MAQQTPPVSGGAAGMDAYRLQSDRIAASAAATSAKAQQEATDNRIAAQNKLYSILGISGNGINGGLLGSVDTQDPRVAWVDAEHRANRDAERGLVAGMGEAQQMQINRDFGNARGTALSRLDARGLGSSSMVGDALASVSESQAQANANLQEQLLGQRLGVETRSNANITGAMENELLRNQEDKALKSSYAGLIGSVWS